MSLTKFILLLLVTISVNQAAKADEILIGETQITIPEVVDFVDLRPLSEEYYTIMKQFVPSTNKLQKVYILNDDSKRIPKGQELSLDRYIMVQSIRGQENDSTYSRKDFLDLKNELKSINMGSEKIVALANDIFEDASEFMEDEYDTRMSMHFETPQNLGISWETDRAISLTLIQSHNDTVNEQPVSYNQVSEITALNISGKIIFIYIFDTYNAPEDITWGSAKSKEITTSFFNNNNSYIPTSKRGIDWGNVLTNALIWGLLGGIFSGVISWRNKKKLKQRDK